VSNFHLQEIQTLQNSLREREEYVTELENRLRALWDKYDGDRKHYMDRIKRLEELGNELRECANQLGWTSSDDSRWIERAESAVKAWDKEDKL
jgi:DNA repair exonuclease SbcCD ATPase subunit